MTMLPDPPPGPRPVVINLYPVAAGGGLQNALSFLASLAEAPPRGWPYVVFCRAGSPIHESCQAYGLPCQAFPAGLAGRVRYELGAAARAARGRGARVVFSLFGGAPLVYPPRYRVSGFAYSNILMPEVPFWHFLKPVRRARQALIDGLRTHLALRNQEIIVETDFLAERARDGLFAGKRLHVVRMAPSKLVLAAIAAAPRPAPKATWDVLCLAGPHPNKRIARVADVVDALRRRGVPARLVTTLPEAAPLRHELAARLAGDDRYSNLGPVPPERVGEVLGTVDALANVALLESFSNNWVEAWAAGLPLIATDARWCRAACGAGAIYVDPEQPDEAAARIAETTTDPIRLAALLAAGRAQLADLPTPEARFAQYMAIIDGAILAAGP